MIALIANDANWYEDAGVAQTLREWMFNASEVAVVTLAEEAGGHSLSMAETSTRLPLVLSSVPRLTCWSECPSGP
jgi:hypothetical protein